MYEVIQFDLRWREEKIVLDPPEYNYITYRYVPLSMITCLPYGITDAFSFFATFEDSRFRV
ncbi:hypothetical protein DPMN_147033 [Dreissena polymorpha]|uniref:Uncharacterized protein n=1 Tax=Dreissena polymorpha TaxID=45954 RepID=A0A9D4J2L2_DREPO|nr:hypothetical protein DPMN_147033 [Dreissena polymorpha]